MKTLIETMAKSLVDKPEEVKVTEIEGEKPLYMSSELLLAILER